MNISIKELITIIYKELQNNNQSSLQVTQLFLQVGKVSIFCFHFEKQIFSFSENILFLLSFPTQNSKIDLNSIRTIKNNFKTNLFLTVFMIIHNCTNCKDIKISIYNIK